MGIFTKPTAIDIDKVLPYVSDQPENLVWEVTDTSDGVDTITVQGYTNDELDEAFSEFESDAEYPKVLRYAEDYDPHNFSLLDYTRGLDRRLAPERTFVNGVLTHVNYYASVSLSPYGTEVFDDLVVVEDYEYTRNADGFALARSMTIKWLTEAETYHEVTKNRFKTYNLTESIRETDRRRRNILDTLKTNMIGIFVQGMGMTVDQAVQTGQSFFEHHITNIIAFKEIGEVQTLIDAIGADSTHPWLEAPIAPNVTMRQYIMSTLSGAILVAT